MEDLIELSEVVRRVVGARVRDRHLVEDLTQETLVRVAAAEPRLAPDARQAYAIVTARNLMASHARSESVHDRHVHRLVDYTTLDGPEQLTLEREETDALANALQQIGEDDRDLLLAHEANGASTADLAAATGTTVGAVAMRLARARATLRLEFVLAYRRVELPTARCRPILLALSAGDRRRQHSLGAAAHLLTCSVCAQLARPVAERRRGIAVWLFVPAAEAARRAVRSLRHSRLTQAVAVAAAVGVAALAGVGLARSDRTAEVAATAPAPSPVVPPVTTSPAPTAPARSSLTVTPTPTPTSLAATSLAPVCPPSVPLDELDAATGVGCSFALTELTVVDVPADEGFWARTVTAQPVFVQLIGEGESPVDIEAGTAVVVTGVLAAEPGVGSAAYVLHVGYSDITAS